jgi:hypothetical protein
MLDLNFILGALSAIVPLVLWLVDRRSKKLEIRKQQADLEKKDQSLENLKQENHLKDLELKRARMVIPKDLEIIEDVDDVLQHHVLKIIRQTAQDNENVLIENFGLDLESVIPWINNKIIHPIEFDNTHVTIRSLIINPESSILKNLIDGESNITTIAVNASIASARKMADSRNIDKFCMIIRQYDYYPLIHGFIINKKHLFLGFTNIENGKLIGGTQPYIHLIKTVNTTSHLTNHYFQFFTDWFRLYWEESKEIVNVNK